MIQHIIAFSVRNKLFIALLTLGLIGAGIWSLLRVPIDAVPDITNNQVQVITQAPNLGAEDIEQFVTYPIELAVSNLPGVEEIRSISRFGLSVVTIVFADAAGTYLPRQLVNEKLSEVQDNIPSGFGEPFMGPISTGLGEIYQYTLEVEDAYRDRYSIADLRSMQDWIIRRQMAMVPGVIEVNAQGGTVKQYEVAIDPDKLRTLNLSLGQVLAVLEANNQNTGGAYIEKNHQAVFIRGEGLARSLEDLRQIVVKNEGGTPIRIADLAEVRYGEAVRYGAFTKDGKGEAVGGMMLMLKGANSNEVIQAVKERIELIQKSLPEGVRIEPFLDRAKLISRTTSTVSENLIIGGLIVIFILVFLLGNWRGGLIVASTIPLALLFAFVMMHLFDVWANLMSLGAIDFGIIVDGAVIIVESTVFYLQRHLNKEKRLSAQSRNKVAIAAGSRMMNAAFFGQLIILIVFIPILTLEGIEGKMFRPMALTFSFAMIGATLLCLTYVPMMSAWLLRVHNGNRLSWGERLVQRLENLYEPALAWVLRRGAWVMGFALLLLALAGFTFSRMGGEFMPQLDEGDIAFHALLKAGSSLSETIATTTRLESLILEEFPEVEHVMSRIGVAEVPTDPMPMDIADMFIILKPSSEWVSANSKAELIEQIKEKVSVLPGVNYEFTQPIEMRFNELITGVREDLAIKLFGEDLSILASKAEEIGRLVAPIRGIGDLKVEATDGLPQITVHYERSKLAQYGLQIQALNQVVQTAFAGGMAGVIFEGEKRFDLVVRLDSDRRQDIEDLEQLYVDLPGGGQIPLGEVAQISYQSGPMQISRDNTNRRVYVGINVRGRDIQSLVSEIKATLDAELELPPGYYLRYGGAFENLERATGSLKVVVPIALGLIFMLIFFALQSLPQTLMIYMAIPFATIGGIFSLWLRDMPFSISAGVGFVVLFGVAVLNGLVLIDGLNELKAEGVKDLSKRIAQGTRRRIRPILLTALTDIFGFLPMALSTSAGAEVQRPLATVVIGGLISASLLTLFILPLLYQWVERRASKSIQVTPVALILLLGLSLCWPQAGQAQVKFDTLPAIEVERAVAMAQDFYPSLKIKALQQEQAQALIGTAWNLGQTQVFTGGEEVGKNHGIYTLIGIQQQQINLLGIKPNRILQERKVALAAAALELNRIEIAREVRRAWAQALVSQQQYELQLKLDSLFQSFETAARIRYETQATSKLEWTAARNQVQQIKGKTQLAYFDCLIALQKLNLWLGGDSFWRAAHSTPRKLNISVESTRDHPLMKQAYQAQQVADAALGAARAVNRPTFNVQYGIQQNASTFGLTTFQFGLGIPLFNRPQKARISAAVVGQSIAAEQIRQREWELNMAFQNTFQEYLKWEARWQLFIEENVPLAREQKAAALLAYREGALDYLSLIQLLKEAVTVEQQSITAFGQYLDAFYRLLYFTQS